MNSNIKKRLNFKSNFFEVYELSDGIYGVISKANSGMGGNSGFIDMGDYSILIDTGFNLNAAKDLMRAVSEYTNKDPRFVIITHYHLDHVIGNFLYGKDTTIISSENALKNFKTENYNRIKELDKTDLKELEESLKKETDEDKKVEIQGEIEFIKSIRQENFYLREPNFTIDGEIALHGQDKEIRIWNVKKSHTDGDLVIHAPREKILFAGDLLFARTDPWLGSGDPRGWIDVINQLMEVEFEIVVPGHGTLATKEDFSLEKKYITEIMDLVSKRLKSNTVPIEINREDFSEELRSWKSSVLQWNVEFLSKYLNRE